MSTKPTDDGAGRPDDDSGTNPPADGRGRARRRLLASIAVTGGTAITSRSVPEAWKKPALDSMLLPTHAATTVDVPPVSTFTCRVASVIANDDGSVITDGPFFEPAADVITQPSLDDVGLSGIQAEIDPPVSQPVILTYSAPTGIDGLPVPQDGTTDAVTGVADFPDADLIGGGGPFYDEDAVPRNEQLVLTFTTAGFDPCVLTLSFTEEFD